MRIWDHVERRYIEVESVWDGRGSLPGDNDAGFIQRPGSELFREGDSDADEPTGHFLKGGRFVATSGKPGRPVDQALRDRILRECEGMGWREAAAHIGCSGTTVKRARKAA